MKLSNENLLTTKPKPITRTNRVNNSISFKQSSSDNIELSEKALFARDLRNNHITTPIHVKFDGKETQWTMFKDSQMGSQDAFWAQSDSGELYYIKYARNKEKFGHIKSEIRACKLYNLAGIAAPEVKPVLINNKIWGIASKFETDLKKANNPKILHEAFAADAWLANWDSLLFGNTYEKNGKPIKIDNGGALKYRAEGALKPNFSDEVDEIVSLVDGRNLASTYIYSTISYNDLLKSFKKVCNIPDEAIILVAKDEEIAKTLINRKNYMQKFLEKMEETPFTQGKLVDYLQKIKENLKKPDNFNTEEFIKTLTNKINSNIKTSFNSIDFPSTKTVTRYLTEELKKIENNGTSITREELIDTLRTIMEDGFEIENVKHCYELFAYDEKYYQLFDELTKLATETPQKENESISSYMTRIVALNEKHNQEIEETRIKNIKSKLQYEPETKKPTPRPLTESERNQAIEELENQRNSDALIKTFVLKKLTKNSTNKEIYSQWQMAHLGSFEFSNTQLQTAVMQLGGRYNSKNPMKFRTAACEIIAPKKYKQDFENEPVYHWFQQDNPDKFVKSLPDVGEIYTLKTRHCCSTHKHYGEMDYNDYISDLNIKFIMHPKSETSRAYNLGRNQEVIYPAGEQFKILDKTLVEDIDPKTGNGYMRWEIHMQEV